MPEPSTTPEPPTARPAAPTNGRPGAQALRRLVRNGVRCRAPSR